MLSFPFEIPPSLYSYIEQFEDAPQRITEKLEHHLNRRGQDPVGRFLLAWFYLKLGKREQAVKHAIKAKACAPGSPLLEYLPYFISHPQNFDAWQPTPSDADDTITEPVFETSRYPGDTSDLDDLIERISRVNPEKIREQHFRNEASGPAAEKNAAEGEEEDKDLFFDEEWDDIVSETLADIYEKQNRFQQAIEVYKKLAEIHPEEAENYQAAIQRLEKRIEEQKE